MIARFVSTADIHRMLNEANPTARYSYERAKKLKKLIIKLHENEFGYVQLFDKDRIPLSWVEHYFSEQALTPKKKKAHA